MKQRTPVLIVGAGPVGLAIGCALWQRGVPARVVEAQKEPHTGSRAVQLHPPTLRVFREVGILEEAERAGLRIRSTSYHLAGGRTLRVALGAENEPLMLPQEDTGRLLEAALERAGGRVERSVRVTDVATTGDVVTVKAEGPQGPEMIEADWLVAADGVRSTVREQLGIDFAGSAVPTDFLLAEGRIDGAFERDAVHYFLGRTGSVVFASMPGGRTRVSGAVPADHPVTPAGVQRLLDERGPGGIAIDDLDMVNRFTSQERIASALRKGRCFLVGDAAHTHSPLGGQGLNLGLQDAHNLAWKLAGVIDGALHPRILDTYEAERRQAAEQIVRTTHQFLKVFMLGPVAARVRNTVWSALETTGVLRRWFVPLLAGWRVHYPDTLSEGPRKGTRETAVRSRGLPSPGRRAPHWVPAPATAGPAGFRLVTLGPADGGTDRGGRALAQGSPVPLAHEHVPRRTPGFLLLRPDGYVAAGGTTPAELADVRRLLARMAPHDPSKTTGRGGA
ncbi:FAD-dependent monooxygenase [Streptomyces glomeratus]|uniref:FAD-dependent monooxygenase n=1 Tax=Streptomyces glomeratus TaxID=284452 RepID=A0ABP6M3T0_9ACTN|nr:FAD-dependent monooxygenase [Streptomyces glomeratus]MCF1512698.1 FAD-dependent monooxygenase [Streptomyces glomeratus]